MLFRSKTRKEAEKECIAYITLTSIQTEQEFLLFTARNKAIIKTQQDYKIKDMFELFSTSPCRSLCAEKTLHQHQMHWQTFVNWLADNRPGITKGLDIDKHVAQEFFKYLATVKPGQAYNYVLISLKFIFRILYSDQPNPFQSIIKRYVESSSRKEFTDSMFNKVLNAFNDPRLLLLHKDEMRVLFYISAYTGLRFKDCINFSDELVNIKRNTLKCVPYKTRKKRPLYVHIPLAPELKEQLLLAQASKKDSYYLPNLLERYNYNPWGVTRDANKVINWGLWDDEEAKDLCQRLKAPHSNQFTFSSLRHTFVSFCANAGVPLEYVAAIVGHSCVSMTRYYTHIQPHTMQQVIDALPRRL